MSTPSLPQTPPRSSESRFIEDEVSFVDLLLKTGEWACILWGERRFVAKVVGGAIALGLVFAFGSNEEYIASTRILPYRAAAAGSGLSGLAGLAGVRLPQGAADQTITAELYPEVARTLDFRAEIAETPIRFSSLSEPATPMKYFRDIARPSTSDRLRQFTIGLPGTLLSAVRRPEIRVVTPPAESGPAIRYFDSQDRAVLDEVGRRLTATADKRNIITISGRMPDRFAAADLVRIASERLMARIIDYEAKKAAEQLRFVEEQAAAAKTRLDRVQREQAVLSDRSRGTVSATAQLEAQRLEREYSLAFDLYRQFSSELEQARIKRAQDTPVFTVLEQVVVPHRRSSPRRGVILLAAFVLGMTGAVCIVVGRRLVAAH